MFVGVGETDDEIKSVLRDLRDAGCRSLTIGQYLQPSTKHLNVERFVHPDEFDELAVYAESIGFDHVSAGPLVRSSYHAEEAVNIYKIFDN
jgi:lipoic acid synthetase